MNGPLRYFFYGLLRFRCIFRGHLVRLAIKASGGRCGPGLRVECGLRIRQGLHKGIQLGSRVYIGKDVTIDCPPGGKVQIGNQVTLTQGIFISAVQHVLVGDDTMIGEYSSLRDSNHGIELGKPMIEQPLKSAGIDVGNDVWIGRGCAILAGTKIGDGAVVGANAVVTKNVDDNAIVVGNPARFIRYRE